MNNPNAVVLFQPEVVFGRPIQVLEDLPRSDKENQPFPEDWQERELMEISGGKQWSC